MTQQSYSSITEPFLESIFEASTTPAEFAAGLQTYFKKQNSSDAIPSKLYDSYLTPFLKLDGNSRQKEGVQKEFEAAKKIFSEAMAKKYAQSRVNSIVQDTPVEQLNIFKSNVSDSSGNMKLPPQAPQAPQAPQISTSSASESVPSGFTVSSVSSFPSLGSSMRNAFENTNSINSSATSVPSMLSVFPQERLKKPIVALTPEEVKNIKGASFTTTMQRNKDYQLNKYGPVAFPFADAAFKQAKQVERINSMSKFMGDLSKEETAYLKSSDAVTWNKDKGKYIFNSKALQRKMNSLEAYPNRLKKNMVESNRIIEQQYSTQEVNNLVPIMVKEVIQANEIYSKAGLGPISKNGYGLYAGRWVDFVTGRVRVLPKATNKFLNPTSYSAKLEYLQARLLNQWNKYMAAEHQLYNFQSTSASTWREQQRNSIKRGFGEEMKVNAKTVEWMLDQIDLSTINGALLPKSSVVVLACFNDYDPEQYKKFKAQLKKLDDQENVTNAEIQALNRDYLVPAGKKSVAAIDRKTLDVVTANKLENLIVNSFMVWSNKALGRTQRSLQKIARLAIPESISEEELIQFQKGLDELKNLKYRYITDDVNPDELSKAAIGKGLAGFNDVKNRILKMSSIEALGKEKIKLPNKLKEIQPDMGPLNYKAANFISN